MDVDVNIEITSRGPVHYRGHWITYGIIGAEWEMRCSACGTSISGEAIRLMNLVEMKSRPLFWMYKLHSFDECTNPTDSWQRLLTDKMKMELTGRTPSKMLEQEVSEKMSDLFAGPRPNIDIDTP